MNTPVIIAAFDEEKYIGETLRRLSPSVEPIVTVNGSTDKTAEIARDFGATVLDSDEQGKMPAIQRALRFLGKRALEPVLYLDADSYPVFSAAWHKSHIKKLDKSKVAVTAGALGYWEGFFISNSLRYIRRSQKSVEAFLKDDTSAVYGANMATKFGTYEILDRVLAMPHIWPGEDRAMADAVRECGGTFSQLISPASTVLMSARYTAPLTKRFRKDYNLALAESLQRYQDRAAPNVEFSYGFDRQVHLSLSETQQ